MGFPSSLAGALSWQLAEIKRVALAAMVSRHAEDILISEREATVMA